jgi:hypothetical protein
MLKRSPKLKLKTFPPTVSVGVVISPPAAQLRRRKGRIVTAASFYAAERNVEYRKNKKPKDRIRCYSVRMRDSDVTELFRDYEMGQRHDNQSLTPRQVKEKFDKAWIEMAGPVIAAAAVSTIKRKK